MICLLLFTGCSSIDGTTENHRATANLVTSHVEPGQEEPEEQPFSPDHLPSGFINLTGLQLNRGLIITNPERETYGNVSPYLA
jgi:hypothetical protein